MWDVHCIHDTYIEDNDSEPDEEDDEEEEVKAEDALDRPRTTLREIRRGISLFIEKEKKTLRRLCAAERARKQL